MLPKNLDLFHTTDDDIKGCNIYYLKKEFSPMCKYMNTEICNNYLELIIHKTNEMWINQNNLQNFYSSKTTS